MISSSSCRFQTLTSFPPAVIAFSFFFSCLYGLCHGWSTASFLPVSSTKLVEVVSSQTQAVAPRKTRASRYDSTTELFQSRADPLSAATESILEQGEEVVANNNYDATTNDDIAFASVDDRAIQQLATEGRIDDAIDLIQQILQEAQASILQLKSFHSILKACSNEATGRRPRRRTPGGASSTVSRPLGNAGGWKANQVIQLMKQFHFASRLDRQPHVGTYTMAMNAWVKSRHPKAAREAEKILNQIPQKTKDRPSVISYTVAMNAYAKRGDATKTEQIFHRMIQDYKQNGSNPTSRPGVQCFTTLMDAWARSGEPDSGEKCTRMLDYMDSLYNSGDMVERPNAISYTTTISAWTKLGNSQQAEAIFKRMMYDYKSRNNDNAKPTVKSFNLLMDAWIRSSTVKEAGERCDKLLDQMDALYYNNNNNGSSNDYQQVRPNIASYTTAINAWAKQGNPRKAEAVFDRMVNDYIQNGNKRAKPTVWTYNSLMGAWTRSNSPDAGTKCEELLNQMMDSNNNNIQSFSAGGGAAVSGRWIIRPDTITYTTAISAWAKLGKVDRAEAIFNRMMDSYNTGNVRAKPNVRSYGSFMNAWARSGLPESGKKCEELLDQMILMYEAGELESRPPRTCYNSAISAWAMLGNVKQATTVLERMKRTDYPNMDAQSFSFLMTAWTKKAVGSPNAAAEECSRLLDEMETMYNSGEMHGKPIASCYAIPISTWAKLGEIQKAEAIFDRMVYAYDAGNPYVRPQVECFNSLLDGWSKSGSPEAGEMCEKMLDAMEDMHDDSLRLYGRPNTVSYTSVINTWAKLGNALRAEAVYERMIREYESGNGNAKPNIWSMNCLLEAWANSGLPDAGPRCEALLNKMKQMYKSGDLDSEPDTISYTTIINAWGKEGNAKRAEETLDLMLNDQKAGNSKAKPDIQCLSSLMVAWAKSGLPDAGPKGDAILGRMSKEWNVEPNEIFLQSLLQCWQQSSDDLERSKRIIEIQMEIAML